MNISMNLSSQKDRMPLKIAYSEEMARERIQARLNGYFSGILSSREIIVVCIGTDRSTGDSLGPIVGSRLLQLGMPADLIYGNLNDPVHAMNLNEVVGRIKRNHIYPFIVAIDACLGQSSSVGHIQVGDGPVKPGAGVNKELPPVGDIHVTGIVNVGGFMEYFVLQNTRLSLVFNMAELMADSLYSVFVQTNRVTSAAARLD